MASTSFEAIYSYVKEYIQAKEGGKTPPSQLKKMRDSVFGELCRYFKPYMTSHASNMSRLSRSGESVIDVADLVQDGNVGLLEALEVTVDAGPNSFEYFCKRCVQSRMWDGFKSYYGEGSSANAAEWGSDIPETPHFPGFDTEELRCVLAAALDVLDEREYTAIGLCIYGDMPEVQAAVLMGVSQKTVNRIKASALKKIEAYLLETHGAEVINELRESAIQEAHK